MDFLDDRCLSKSLLDDFVVGIRLDTLLISPTIIGNALHSNRKIPGGGGMVCLTEGPPHNDHIADLCESFQALKAI